MAQALINLGQTDTGKVIGDFTWDWCTTWAGVAVATTGATLTEIGDGCYIIENPNVTAKSEFRVYLTATPTKWARGTFESTPASPAAPTGTFLCTLAAVKAALNIPTATTSKDTLIESLMYAAGAWAERYCGRTFASTTYTEYFSPGYDRRVRKYTELIPRQWPIISVTSIREDADRAFTAASTLLDAADYWNDDNRVYLFDDEGWVEFDAGMRTVQLVYVAGYATIPQDVQRAAVMLTVKLFYDSDRQKQGIASESLGGTTITYVDEDMPKAAKAILDLYRRPCGVV